MRKPTLEGIGGSGWEMLSLADPTDPTFHTCMAQWIVQAPHAHPFWSWYVVGVVHLRPDPVLPDAKKHYADAEYELSIYAINPDQCPPDVETGRVKCQPLVPIDQVVQFDGTGDRGAAKLGELAVRAIVDGVLSPDQDFRAAWRNWVPDTANSLRDYQGE